MASFKYHLPLHPSFQPTEVSMDSGVVFLLLPPVPWGTGRQEGWKTNLGSEVEKA